MWEDPIVAEVRHVREELAGQYNFDVSAIFTEIRNRQTQLGSRLVRRGGTKQAKQVAAPDRDSTALHSGR